MSRPAGLYVHIPFCKSKCHYCDFASGPGTADEIERYLGLLEVEAEREACGQTVDTVFVGGGTPSLLSPAQLERLFRQVVGRFVLAPGAEVTVEGNPESLDPGRAACLAALGVNRVSLGAQSFDDGELRKLGRIHRAQQTRDAVKALRDHGLHNFNLDLICGFPGNTAVSLHRSIDAVLELSPAHVSLYLYQHEEHSHWGRSDIELPDDDLQVDLYYEVKDRLEAAGYGHYEISNFALSGRECRHNLKYWSGDPYVGLGASAAGFVDGLRVTNPSDLLSYERWVRHGVRAMEPMDSVSRARELVMLRMRLLDGVERLPAELGETETGRVRDILEHYAELGLVRRQGEGYALSRRGLLLSNEVFAELI